MPPEIVPWHSFEDTPVPSVGLWKLEPIQGALLTKTFVLISTEYFFCLCVEGVEMINNLNFIKDLVIWNRKAFTKVHFFLNLLSFLWHFLSQKSWRILYVKCTNVIYLMLPIFNTLKLQTFKFYKQMKCQRLL